MPRGRNRTPPNQPCHRCRQRLTKSRVLAGIKFCNPCHTKLALAWQQYGNRSARWLEKYRITARQHAILFATQLGVCAICRDPERTERRGLVVDHDHKTGEVRGLLCSMCNSGIGLLGDRSDWIANGLRYVERRSQDWQLTNYHIAKAALEMVDSMDRTG